MALLSQELFSFRLEWTADSTSHRSYQHPQRESNRVGGEWELDTPSDVRHRTDESSAWNHRGPQVDLSFSISSSPQPLRISVTQDSGGLPELRLPSTVSFVQFLLSQPAPHCSRRVSVACLESSELADVRSSP
ncbi:unnamed protein product [Protopolystoma xenopodis]|uniref:Uncharacterized protein n=1 Tax=Protopolystoma xenopodis TaxID=117903 RepID=A0A3S4ZL64_9PLAT|nr:unnamed protein product [Protopolystoma xenopodis]